MSNPDELPPPPDNKDTSSIIDNKDTSIIDNKDIHIDTTTKDIKKVKTEVNSGLEFIEILTGRTGKAHLGNDDYINSKTNKPFITTTDKGVGDSWPRIDPIYWETKDKWSMGVYDSWAASGTAKRQEKNPRFDPLNAIEDIQKRVKTKLDGTKLEKSKEILFEAFKKYGLHNDESPFYISNELFEKNMKGESTIFKDTIINDKGEKIEVIDRNLTPMDPPPLSDDPNNNDDYSDGITDKETTTTYNDSSDRKRHEIFDAYMNMQYDYSDINTVELKFKECIGGLHKQCKSMYETIPENKRQNAEKTEEKSEEKSEEKTEEDDENVENKDIKNLKNCIDLLEQISSESSKNDYYVAVNKFFNFNMKDSKVINLTETDTIDDDPNKLQSYKWYMDLFIFAYNKYKEYEKEWIKIAEASHQGEKGAKIGKFTQLGGDDTDSDEETDNGVELYYDGNEENANRRRLPARPNPLVLIPAIIVQVYFIWQLIHVINRINNAFTAYNERVEVYRLVEGRGDLFAGPDNETCWAGFSFSILYEFLRNYFWDGFEMSLGDLRHMAQLRLRDAAAVISNQATAATADTWLWGSLSFFANAAAGTTTRYVTQNARNQASYEATMAFQTGMNEFNQWANSFDYTIRSTTTTLVLGMNGCMASTLVILNQINPRAVNRYSVMAALSGLGAQFVTPAGEAPLGAMITFYSQLGLTTRSVRNFMLGRLDNFGPMVSASAESNNMDLTRHYTHRSRPRRTEQQGNENPQLAIENPQLAIENVGWEENVELEDNIVYNDTNTNPPSSFNFLVGLMEDLVDSTQQEGEEKTEGDA